MKRKSNSKPFLTEATAKPRDGLSSVTKIGSWGSDLGWVAVSGVATATRNFACRSDDRWPQLYDAVADYLQDKIGIVKTTEVAYLCAASQG